MWQMATLCWWNIVQRERSGRSHFTEIRALRSEQRRLDGMLSLLLPPTVIAKIWGGTLRKGSDGTRVEAIDGGLGVQSIFGTRSIQRFAQKFQSASVLFAEISQSEELLRLSPAASLLLLDRIFLVFDDLVTKVSVEICLVFTCVCVRARLNYRIRPSFCRSLDLSLRPVIT